jgi:hypothetical protein
MFFRKGINDFRMYWTVIGFYEEMLYIEIDEKDNKDKLYLEVNDIEKHVKESF